MNSTGVLYDGPFKEMFNCGFWPKASIYMSIYILFWHLQAIYGISCLIGEYKSATNTKKLQIKYFAIAIAIGYLGGASNWPMWYGKFPNFTNLNILITVFITIIAYTIVKHRLLDIEIVIKRTLVYSTLIALISAVYFMMIYLSERLFSNLIGYNSMALTITIIAILTVIFNPLKSRIRMFIDRSFFRGSIDQINEENIKLRDEIQKSEKMKAVATLAAGMAHEIKNPLTAIKTFNQYLPEKYSDPEFIKKFNSLVGSEVDKINYIVKQLLEFSKPSELKLKKTDINQLLDDTLSLMSNDLIKNNIKIEKQYVTLPPISVDPVQMKQVFLNLFLNAIDAMKNGGILTITTNSGTGPRGPAHVDHDTGAVPRATCPRNKLTITIRDTGKGINNNDLRHIFDPFFTEKDGGTGLGLSVVHGIIEKHNGKIEVSSIINSGTEFKITL